MEGKVKTCLVLAAHLFIGYHLNAQEGIIVGSLSGALLVFISLTLLRLASMLILPFYAWLYPSIIEDEERNGLK